MLCFSCLYHVFINKYLSNESSLALPISLVPFNQSYSKLLFQMYSKLAELGIPCLMRLIYPEFSSLGVIKVLTIILCGNNNIIFNGNYDNLFRIIYGDLPAIERI